MTSERAVERIIPRLQLQIGGVKIPRILLGTSPFIGAGQFGGRAYLYHLKFYMNPMNIVKIASKAVELGVTGVQALPHRPILQALKAVEGERGVKLTVVGTIGPDDPIEDIKSFKGLNTVAMVLHGALTDGRSERQISKLLDEIRAANSLAGVATHHPFSTLSWLLRTELDVDLIMLPFNKLGAFMDAKPERVAELVKGVKKPVLGKKALAAGRIPPDEALSFVAKSGCIDAVALGIASEHEAEETFKAAACAFSNVP